MPLACAWQGSKHCTCLCQSHFISTPDGGRSPSLRFCHHPNHDCYAHSTRDHHDFLRSHCEQMAKPDARPHWGHFYPPLQVCCALPVTCSVPLDGQLSSIRLMQPSHLLDEETEVHSGEMTCQRHMTTEQHTGIRTWCLSS